MKIPYMAQVAFKMVIGDPEGAVETTREGLAYYGDQVRNAVNGTPSIDRVLLFAPMKATIAAIEADFNEGERKLAYDLLERIAVMRMDVDAGKAGDDG